MAAETIADTNIAGLRPAPQRLTQKQDKTEVIQPLKGEYASELFSVFPRIKP